jgi:hypothetical protein
MATLSVCMTRVRSIRHAFADVENVTNRGFRANQESL